MQARILDKKEEALWANFVKNHPFSTIHQTPEWGHFQEKTPGRGKYWIVVLEDPGRPESSKSPASSTPKVSPVTLSKTPSNPQRKSILLAGTLLVRHSLPKGYCWLYAPRGPLLDYELATTNPALLNEQMSLLLEEIKKIAKQEKAVFLRIDPPIVSNTGDGSTLLTVITGDLTNLGDGASLTHVGQAKHTGQPLKFPHFHPTSHGFQPNETLILNLTLSGQELLTQMKQKGRYNIKLAEKKGVQIIKSTPATLHQDLQDFYKILTETATRDGFHGHDLAFYENMLGALNSDQSAVLDIPKASKINPNSATSPSPSIQLYLAKHENQTLAGAIVTFHKDTATYYYGASSNQHRELMAPYLLHWQIIKEAKQNGYTSYDLFGISPLNAKTHPWKTVSEFKRKFGGIEIAYQKPQEYSFKKLLHTGYKLYKSVR